jgi:protein gp37
MAETTGISWTDSTWSPVTGCSKVSPGCDHCYAATFTERLEKSGQHKKYGGLARNREWTGEVRLHPDVLHEPLWWKKPRRVFVCSMSDLFHPKVPFEFIMRVFNIMACTEWHTYQLLTKRPGRMAYFAEKVWPRKGGRWEPLDPAAVENGAWPGTAWPSNVWAGTSVESQKYAPRLKVLARVPAKVRFVSVEPLLERVELYPFFFECSGCGQSPCACKGLAIHQVIVGGESGPGFRPMDMDWLLSLETECDAAGVSLFVKQDSGPRPGMQGRIPEHLWNRKEMP